MEYNIIRQIGEGSFSQVYLVEKDNRQYIYKKYLSRNIQEAEREFLFLKMIGSKHVPEAIEIVKNENPGIIQEYVKGVSIEEYLKVNPDRKYILQIRLCEVLSEIHSFGICLNDIKPDNIIVRDHIPVFIDFGLATLNNYWDKRIRGSISYASPEKLKKQINTQASDVFSLGLMLYYTENLKHFADNFDPAEYQKVLSDNNLWNNAREQYIHNTLVTELLDYSPENRPSAISLFLRISKETDHKITESSFNLLKSYVFTCHHKSLAKLRRNRKITVTIEDEPDIITTLFITKEISESNKVVVLDEELFKYNTDLFMSRLRDIDEFKGINENNLIEKLLSSEYKILILTRNELSGFFHPLHSGKSTFILLLSETASEASFVDKKELADLSERLGSEINPKSFKSIKPLSAKKFFDISTKNEKNLNREIEHFFRIYNFFKLPISMKLFQRIWKNWTSLLKYMLTNSIVNISDNSISLVKHSTTEIVLNEKDKTTLSSIFSDWNDDLFKIIYYIKNNRIPEAEEASFHYLKTLAGNQLYLKAYFSYKLLSEVSERIFNNYFLGKVAANILRRNGYKLEALNLYERVSKYVQGNQKGTLALDKAIVLQDLNRQDEAEKEYIIAAEIFQTTSNAKSLVRTTNNLGTFYTLRKDYKKAQSNFYRVIELSDSLKDDLFKANYRMIAYNNLSEITLENGLWNKCIQLSKKALEISIIESNKTVQNHSEAVLLTALYASGKTDDIQELVSEMLESVKTEQVLDTVHFIIARILFWASANDKEIFETLSEKYLTQLDNITSDDLLMELFIYCLKKLNIEGLIEISMKITDESYRKITEAILKRDNEKILNILHEMAASNEVFHFLYTSRHLIELEIITKKDSAFNYIKDFHEYNDFHPLDQLLKDEKESISDGGIFWDAFSNIQSQENFESIAMETLKSILKVGNLERAIFFAYKKGEFITELCINDQMDILPKENMKVSKTILMETVQEKKMMYYFNLQEDTPFDLHSSIFGLGLRTAICYPIVVNKITKGVIYSDAQADRTFNNEEKKMLETFLMLCESIMEKNQLLDDINNPVLSSMNFQSSNQYNEIIGTSRKMQKVFSLMNVVAKHNVNVLITGETGSGKELIARALHSDYAKSAPFVAVNCAAIPENLLESELFGYVKGAFTGAVQNKMGKLELANNGTLFLDEIGDMPFQLQAKLLRVIQEREFTPIGDVKSKPVSVRIISATNRNLEEMILSNEFRQDLLFRLKVFEIEIPALKDRKEDIPLLIHHFIKLNNEKFGKDIKGISSDAVAILQSREWKGNVRELQNEIEKATILCQSDVITEEQFVNSERKESFNLIDEMPDTWKDFLDYKRNITRKLDNIFVNKILKSSDGNISQAGKLSGIPRNQIYRILKQ